MLEQIQAAPASEPQVKAMLQHMVRTALTRMIARQESEIPPGDTENYLRDLAVRRRHVEEAQRSRDWSVAAGFAEEVARQNGLDPTSVETPAVARQVLSLLRQLTELGEQVEQTFQDPVHAGRDLLLRYDMSDGRGAGAADAAL